ncbi:MAG: hypothetical protein Q9199_003966 [Rusavskia elegans]
MTSSHEDDATGHESHIPNRTMEQAERKAKKRAARGERERKSREAKRVAREAAKLEAGDIPEQGRVPKQHSQVGNKPAHLYRIETTEWAMLQARRWLNNERRKLDKGGMTQDGVADFVKWTRQGDGYDWTPSEQCENANVTIKRFLEEMKAAKQARGKTSNLKDWWEVEPPHSASARRKLAAKNIDGPKAKKGTKSEADASGGASMEIDVDQTEHELAAGGIRDASGLPEPVSLDTLGVPASEGKDMQGHADNNNNNNNNNNSNNEDNMSRQLKLVLRLGSMKVEEAYEHGMHDVGPESVACQALDEVKDPVSDMDDMAPEPVLRAGFEEDEETM